MQSLYVIALVGRVPSSHYSALGAHSHLMGATATESARSRLCTRSWHWRLGIEAKCTVTVHQHFATCLFHLSWYLVSWARKDFCALSPSGSDFRLSQRSCIQRASPS